LLFDIFLGGGYRTGVTRFKAFPEHGKSSQALCWAAEWLKQYPENGVVVYIDGEGKINDEDIQECGIRDLPNYKWGNVKEVESGTFHLMNYNVYDRICDYLRSNLNENAKKKDKDKKKFFIVLDSLDAMIASGDLEKSFSEAAKIGAAQVISAQMMKQIGAYMMAQGHHCHILSQIRANLDINNPNSPKTKSSGGYAMEHAPMLIGDIKKDYTAKIIFENPKGKTLQEKGKPIGKWHCIKFTKTFHNKTGQVLEIPIKYGHGIWLEREVIFILKSYGMIQGNNWYSIEESFAEQMKEALGEDIKVKWQGEERIVTYLEENPKVCQWLVDEIKNRCLEVHGEREEEDDIL